MPTTGSEQAIPDKLDDGMVERLQPYDLSVPRPPCDSDMFCILMTLSGLTPTLALTRPYRMS